VPKQFRQAVTARNELFPVFGFGEFPSLNYFQRPTMKNLQTVIVTLTLLAAFILSAPDLHALTALDFPGDNLTAAGGSYARKTDPVGLPEGDQSRTFEAWIYLPTDYIPNTGIFSTWDGSYVNRTALGIKIQGGERLYFWTHNEDRTSTGRVPTDQWAHIAVIYDSASGTCAFLINGQDAGTDPISGLNTRITEVTIGSSYDNYNFKGKIREVRLWDRALTVTEIQDQMNATLDVGNAVGLAGYWQLSEGAGARALDQSANANHLTLNDLTAWYFSEPPVPHAANAVAQVVNGSVVGATITGAGFGYTEPPVILIRGGGGSGATATATVANGIVTGIIITSPGSGYTGTPRISIASPPFTPKLRLAVSRVNVTQNVVLGRKYLLESSKDLRTWGPVGAAFVAESEELVQEFVVEDVGQFFRIKQVP
jgi:hypothetical protein